ncbi:hypothetical protein PFLUV_G00147200 [Perca fluviatilis]|uniref:Uncharacterized protein n=1 Tax=Perca fluviatilis TaxID=8168 RepID=A0A6A5EU55_PERFL|nr:hypothetical protein PFLUV_G00147200 [Perca fluviatilis]
MSHFFHRKRAKIHRTAICTLWSWIPHTRCQFTPLLETASDLCSAACYFRSPVWLTGVGEPDKPVVGPPLNYETTLVCIKAHPSYRKLETTTRAQSTHQGGGTQLA